MNPPKEEHESKRTTGDYYVRIQVIPPDTPYLLWKTVFYFQDNTQTTGWYRYVPDDYDWYVFTAVEKLNKLDVNERVSVQWALVLDLRLAIREKFNKSFDSKQYDLPNCRNTLSAINKWIAGVWKKYGPEIG